VPVQDRILSGLKIPVCGVARTTTISHVRPSNRVLMSEYSIKLLYRRSNHLLSRVFGVALSSGPPRSNSFVSHAMSLLHFATILWTLSHAHPLIIWLSLSSTSPSVLSRKPKTNVPTARRKAAGSPGPGGTTRGLSLSITIARHVWYKFPAFGSVAL